MSSWKLLTWALMDAVRVQRGLSMQVGSQPVSGCLFNFKTVHCAECQRCREGASEESFGWDKRKRLHCCCLSDKFWRNISGVVELQQVSQLMWDSTSYFPSNVWDNLSNLNRLLHFVVLRLLHWYSPWSTCTTNFQKICHKNFKIYLHPTMYQQFRQLAVI